MISVRFRGSQQDVSRKEELGVFFKRFLRFFLCFGAPCRGGLEANLATVTRDLEHRVSKQEP